MFSYAVAIVLYNPDVDVLKRIANYGKKFNRVLIVDNSDEISEALVEKIKATQNVIYYSIGMNIGMSGALNYAFQWSIESHVDFLLTMDQDTLYQCKEIDNMINFIEKDHGNAAIYSANYAKLYIKNGKRVSGQLNTGRREQKDVLFSMTSGSWMNTNFLPNILPLDDWFIGFVDYDVCAGIKTRYLNARFVRIGNSVMYQQVGSGTEDNFFNRLFHVVHLSPQRYYYMMRNIELFLNKYQKNKKLERIAKQQRKRILFNANFENNKKTIKKYIDSGIKDGKKSKLGKINEK